MLPLLIAFILKAPAWGFFCMVAGIAGWALCEYYAMVLPGRRYVERWLAIITGVSLMIPLVFEQYEVFAGLITFIVFIFACLFLLHHGTMERAAGDLALMVFGFFYLSIPLAHMVMLRYLEHGTRWILLVLFMVMVNDTSAYFTGTFLGRHKLYPSVSPKKSVEGAVGGLAGSLCAAAVAHWTFVPWTALSHILLLGLVAGVVAELGDLFESLLKRSFGIKDSGALIPGHGGILDRLDSLIFVFPLTYYFALAFQG